MKYALFNHGTFPKLNKPLKYDIRNIKEHYTHLRMEEREITKLD